MKIIEFDSNKLIKFYNKNEIEIDEDNNYIGNDIKSLVLCDKNNILGAISYSKYKNINFIEAIAINKEYRNKGYGKMLLNEIKNKLNKPIYLISKNNEFFLKNGFIYDTLDIISDNCKKCAKYSKICHPKVMIYK